MKHRVFNTVMCILLVVSMLVPAILGLTGCGATGVDLIDARKQVINCIEDTNSTTAKMLASVSASGVNPRKLDALNQYISSFVVSDIEKTRNKEAGTVELSCSVTITTIESIQKKLVLSQSFQEEYKSASKENREQCIYDYVINIILAKEGLDSKNISLTGSGASDEEALNDLKSKYDNFCQQSASEFALATFYSEDSIEEIKKKSVPFVEATDLSDFVIKYGKHKIAVSNIQIYTGNDALQKLIEVNSNNKLVQLDSSQQIYFIQYKITSLTKSKKAVKLENYFSLGDSKHHLYTNSGFHFEGLSTPTSVKYGDSCVFSAALIGDAASELYFYNEQMYGPRHWASVPLAE